MATTVRWTVADLEVLPQPADDRRYELVDGELHVTTQPSAQHQMVSFEVGAALREWDPRSASGVIIPAPGLVFAADEAVAPDLVWIRRERLASVLGDDGKLHNAPDLAVEVLSPGAENARRDREVKLGVYGRRGIREYWIVDWQQRTVAVYRSTGDTLALASVLAEEDDLTSPLLPGLLLPVSRLFATLP